MRFRIQGFVIKKGKIVQHNILKFFDQKVQYIYLWASIKEKLKPEVQINTFLYFFS
jgi:hypothetical protein